MSMTTTRAAAPVRHPLSASHRGRAWSRVVLCARLVAGGLTVFAFGAGLVFAAAIAEDLFAPFR